MRAGIGIHDIFEPQRHHQVGHLAGLVGQGDSGQPEAGSGRGGDGTRRAEGQELPAGDAGEAEAIHVAVDDPAVGVVGKRKPLAHIDHDVLPCLPTSSVSSS